MLLMADGGGCKVYAPSSAFFLSRTPVSMSIESKPSRNEDEYFARVDADLRKALRQKADADRAAGIAAERNKCPRDGATLEATDRSHVTIDVCPKCGGVWLDKGELEILAAGNAEHSGFVGSLLNIFK